MNRAALFLALGLLLVAGCSPRGMEALRKGDAALAAGKVEVATPLLEQAVQDLPDNAVAWSQLGLAYHRSGNPDEARKAYLRALEFNRNLFDIHHNLGSLEYEARRWVDAERHLRVYLGIERNRTNVMAWRLLGESQLATQQLDAAERTLSIAAQLSLRDPALRNGLGRVMAQKRRWREAQTQFGEALKLRPQYPEALLNLAIVQHQIGDRKGALDRFQAYLALNPKGPQAAQVQELARQLDLTLNPPRAAATNAVATRALSQTNRIQQPVAVVGTGTNPPSKSSASAPNPLPTTTSPSLPTGPTTVTAGATNPPPTPTKPTTPVTPSPIAAPVPTPVPAPEPPLEVVRVEETPEFRTAREPETQESQPTSGTTAATPVPGPTAPETTAVVETETETEQGSEAPARDAGQRKGFWQRMDPSGWTRPVVRWGNPVKWFRGDTGATKSVSTNAPIAKGVPAPEPKPVPPPPVVTPIPAPRPIVTAPTTRITPLPKPEPPAPPIIARFPRGPAPVLAKGNRAAAEAAAAQTTTDRVTALGKAVELDPSWSQGWQQLVRAALETGRVDIALTAGESATTLEPRSAAAHQLFAAALARSGYSVDAAEELDETVKLGADSAANRLALAGLCVREMRDPKRARPHYQRVLELEPNHPQAAAIRAWLEANPE